VSLLFEHASQSPRLPRQAFDRAVSTASARHRVPVKEIVGRLKRKPIAHARQHAMWLLRQDGYSYPEIGRAFGHADHTSAFWGVRSHAKRQVAA
jgi:chromosomal replication initiation ATPase DnaA